MKEIEHYLVLLLDTGVKYVANIISVNLKVQKENNKII